MDTGQDETKQKKPSKSVKHVNYILYNNLYLHYAKLILHVHMFNAGRHAVRGFVMLQQCFARVFQIRQSNFSFVRVGEGPGNGGLFRVLNKRRG